MLIPATVVTKLPAVITPEDDDGVIDHALFFEFSEDATELGIDVGNTGAVAVDEFFGLLIRAGAFFGNAILSADFAPSCEGFDFFGGAGFAPVHSVAILHKWFRIYILS